MQKTQEIQDPFDPALHGGVQLGQPDKVTTFDQGAAKVLFRLKGSPKGQGPVYQGQNVFLPCAGCGPRPVVPFRSRKPKPFTLYEPRGERAIVIPWLSVAAVWQELKFCLRAIHRHFADKDCPIYIIGDKPPPWLVPSGRVEFITIPEYQKSREAGLYQAFQIGMQIAQEVGWWNDDIYLLQDTGWDHLRTALHDGNIASREMKYRSSKAPWLNALGEAVGELKLRGKTRVLRFAVHTPYLFEIEKSREIFREYYLHHRGSWVTLYHNHHGTPCEPCGPHKVESLPARSPKARFLNHRHVGPEKRTREELEQRFPDPAPWESTIIAPPPTLGVSIMAHPSRREMTSTLLTQLGAVPVAEDDGSGLIANCQRAWSLAGQTDYHVVIQDDSILCEDFVAHARQFLAKLESPAVVSFYHGSRKAFRKQALAALDAGMLVSELRWGPAICIPVAWIPDMLEFFRVQTRPDDDGRIGDWLKSLGRRCVYSLPCLVDHRHSPSLVGNSHGRRSAVAFLGQARMIL